MAFKWFFFSCFLCSFAFGSVNESIRWDLMSGYRNDTVHWHLINGSTNQLAYSEHARDLQFWDNTLSIKAIYRDIAFFASGSYGAFGSGSMKQRFANLSIASELPLLSWQPDAWNADGWGYFGYSVNLTQDRTYQVILVPFVGYGVDYEQQSFGHSRSTAGEGVSLSASFSGPEKMCWFGPLFGGLFIIQPGSSLRFEAGYAFHRLHLRFFVKKQASIAALGDLLNPIEQDEKIKVKDRANLSHSGWARIDYLISKTWRIGLEGQMRYFASRILDASVKDELSEAKRSDKFKIRWTAVGGFLSISRAF